MTTMNTCFNWSQVCFNLYEISCHGTSLHVIDTDTKIQRKMLIIHRKSILWEFLVNHAKFLDGQIGFHKFKVPDDETMYGRWEGGVVCFGWGKGEGLMVTSMFTVNIK